MAHALTLLGFCLLLAANCPAASAVATPGLSDSVQPFFWVTEKFLDFIQPFDKAILLNDVLTVLLNGSLATRAGNSSQFDWQATVNRYWNNMMGYFILVCIGIFFILLVPLAGLITCCCRCCCARCGGSGRQMEKSGSSCRRGTYGVLLLLLTTAMVLGVVLAFISNELVRQQMDPGQQGGNTVLANFSGTLTEIAALLTDIPDRAKGNSASALELLVAAVLPTTNASVVRLRATLGSSSKADAGLATARTVADLVGMATDHSSSYVSHHANYSNNLDSLDTMLSLLQTNLTGVDVDCPFNAVQSDCDLIADQLPGLQVTQNASKTGLGNVTDLNALLRTVNDTSLSIQLAEMQAALDNVSNVALAYIIHHVYDAQDSLNSSSELDKIWASMEQLFLNLGGFIRNTTYSVNSTVVDPLTQQPDTLESVASKLDLIRYIVYIVIAGLASLVILLWYFGVTYGFCGEPPYEDARCCNKGVGARLLMAATIISFVCYSLLFLAILALFLVGGLADTEICRYLTGRGGSAGYKQLDSNLNQLLQTSSPDLSSYSLNLASGLLDGCSTGNASITAALNIEKLVQASNIDNLVRQFVNQSRVLLQSRRSELVSGVAINAINTNLSYVETVAAAAAAQPLGPFISELQKPMIAGSELVFSAIQNISLTASKADEKSRFVALLSYLDGIMRMADFVTQSQRVSLSGLSTSLGRLNSSISGLTTSLQMAHDSFQTAYNVEQAIDDAMNNLTIQLQVTVKDTVERVIGAAADCQEVNQKMKTLVRVPCVTFLRPFNGFWAGMGLFLICLLPCLVLSVKLTNLYRKTHKYQEDYAEGYHPNATYQGFYRISTVSYCKAPTTDGFKTPDKTNLMNPL